MTASTPLPPVFLSHGSPMTALEPGDAGRFMQHLGPVLVSRFGRPQAILAVSAHTLTRMPVLLAADHHPTVHDFGGFPDALYQLRYDTAGAPQWAPRVQALLARAGLEARVVADGGLDHGIWTVLRHAFPAADIPVLPMGWPPFATPRDLMAMGQALTPLAADGLWILATGSITHNLRRVFANGRDRVDQPPTAESTAFRDWFVQRGLDRDWDALAGYRQQAPFAQLMHPTDEHLLPWHVAAGAGGPDHAALRIHASVTYGDLGMDAYAFGPSAQALADALVG